MLLAKVDKSQLGWLRDYIRVISINIMCVYIIYVTV